MDRRAWLLGCLGVLAVPRVVAAQAPARVFRIGVLAGGLPTDPDVVRLVEAFVHGLRDLGYVDGQNVIVERRHAEGKVDRLPALAAELARLEMDVIVAGAGTHAAVAARRATSTIPIVMTVAGDPVRSGLVTSLARPGGNVTGLTVVAPELIGKQLQLLKEVVPTLSRAGVLWNPNNPASAASVTEAEAAAGSLKIRLQMLPARSIADIGPAFVAAPRDGAGALIVLGDALLFTHRIRIGELALKSRLPSVFAEREHVVAGGLLAFGPSFADIFRRAATYVDKILKGARPADLPVERPTKFELVINLKVAKTLGLTIPPSVLGRADEVIQ